MDFLGTPDGSKSKHIHFSYVSNSNVSMCMQYIKCLQCTCKHKYPCVIPYMQRCVHAKFPTTALNAQISFNKQDLFSRCIYLTSINNYKCSYEGIFMIDM